MKHPFACPVCLGRGLVPWPPGSTTYHVPSTTSAGPWMCQPCDGKGVVWGPPDEGSDWTISWSWSPSGGGSGAEVEIPVDSQTIVEGKGVVWEMPAVMMDSDVATFDIPIEIELPSINEVRGVIPPVGKPKKHKKKGTE